MIQLDQIVIFDKFNHSDDGFKYFIGYKEIDIVKQLCIIMPQMRGYIKCFESEMIMFWLNTMKFGTRLKRH